MQHLSGSGLLIALLLTAASITCEAQAKRGGRLQWSPTKTEAKQEQEKDDLECHRFAKEKTGVDPTYLPGGDDANSSMKQFGTAAAPPAAVAKGKGGPNKGPDRSVKKGELTNSKKSASKARKGDHGRGAALHGSEHEDMLAKYMEAYNGCMMAKGYTLK